MVGQYGSAVLGLPAAHGFDLTAYLVPLAVVLACWRACGAAAPLARASARACSAAPGEPRAPEPLARGPTRLRLESDLARFD